ncbi:unnamed protein product [Auanema sp. JU1783]|nr:unnamed protein product [Auanema sp. JU1783]
MGKKNKKSNQNYWDDEPSEPAQVTNVVEQEEVSFSPKSSGKKGKKGKKGKNITHNGFSTGAFGVLGGGDEDDSMCQLEHNSSDTKANTDLNNNQAEYEDREQQQQLLRPEQATFGSRQSGFGGSQHNAFGGSRQSGFGGSQQNAFGGSQQNAFGGSRQSGFGEPQQNAFGGSQQNAFGGSRQSGFGGSQQSGFGGSQQNAFGGSRQSGFGETQHNDFGGSRQSGFGEPQHNDFGGSRQSGFGGSQQDGFGGSRQSGFGGSQHDGFGGSQNNGFGVSQHDDFGGSRQSGFSASQQKDFGGSRQSGFSSSQQREIGGSRQNGFGGSRQSGFEETQQNEFGSRQSGFGGSQQHGFSGSEQNAFGGSQPHINSGSQQNELNVPQHNAFGGSRKSGFGGSQHNAFGGSRQSGFSESQQKDFRGSRQSGFDGAQNDFGSRQSGFGGSQQNVSSGIQQNDFGGSRQSGFDGTQQNDFGSRQSGFGGSQQQEFHGSQQGSFVGSRQSVNEDLDADYQHNEIGGSRQSGLLEVQQNAFGGSKQSGFAGSRQSGFGGSQQNGFIETQSGISGSRQSGISDSRQSGFLGSQHNAFGGSRRSGFEGSQQNAFGGSRHSGLTGSRNSVNDGSQRVGLSASQENLASYEEQEQNYNEDYSNEKVSISEYSVHKKSISSQRSRCSSVSQSRYSIGNAENLDSLSRGRSQVSVLSEHSRKNARSPSSSQTNLDDKFLQPVETNSRRSSISIHSTNEPEERYGSFVNPRRLSTNSYQDNFDGTHKPSMENVYERNVEQFNQMLGVESNNGNRFGSCQFGSDFDQHSHSKHVTKSTHTLQGHDFYDKRNQPLVKTSRTGSHVSFSGNARFPSDGDEGEGMDDFSETQVQLRSMVNDEKCTNHRLSKLSINTNADEFVLVGGQPPPGVVDGRASCPAGRSRRSRKMMRSTDFLTDQNEQLGGSIRSTSAMSRQSLRSTNEHELRNIGIEEEDGGKCSPDFKTQGFSSAVPSRAVSIQSVDNYVKSSSSLHNDEISIPLNSDEHKKSKDVLEPKMAEQAHYGSRKSVVNRENGDDTEENLLIADYNSRLESHWDLGPSSRCASALSSKDTSHYQNIPDIVIIPPEETSRPSVQRYTPPALRKARMRSKSSADIVKNYSNDDVPQPIIFTDALTPQSVAPRSRIQKNKPESKNCEIAIQTGETIRLRQMTDFSNYESSTDFRAKELEQPNLVFSRNSNQHPAAAVINNFFQQQGSFNHTGNKSHHQVTMIHNDNENSLTRNAPRADVTTTSYYNQTRVEDIPKKPWEIPGAIEIVPKEIAAEMRDQVRPNVLAEAKQPQTPNGSRIQKSKFDEFEKYSREDNSYDSLRNDKRNYTSQSNGSNSSGLYRWTVNNPKSQQRVPDVRWSDNPKRAPGCTVRESVKAGQIRNLASMFNNMQAKAKEEEAVLKMKSSFTNSQDENNNESPNLYIYDRQSQNNSENHMKYNPVELQYQERKMYLNEQKYYPVEPVPEKNRKSWVYSNDIDGALLDVNEESDHGSVIDRYRTSTPLHDYMDHDNMTSQFCRIPSIRSDEPPVTVSRNPSSVHRVPSKASDKQYSSGRRPVQENENMRSSNHYAVVDKHPKNSGDYAEICYMSESPRSKRSSIERSKLSSGDNNGYSAIREKSYRSEQPLQRRPSRGGEYASLTKSQKYGSIVEDTVNEQIDNLFGFVDEQSKQPLHPPQSRHGLHYSISTYRAMQRSNKAHDDAPIRFSPAVAPHASELSECSISRLTKRNSNASNYGLISAHRFGGRPADLVASTPKSSPTHRAPPALEESYMSSISEGSRHEERMNEYKKQFNKLVHQLEMCHEQMDMTQKALLKARKEKKQLLEVTAQRSILIASQRAILLKRELQNIQAVLQLKKQPPLLNHELRGSMSISNITLNLNRGISQRVTDNSSFVFVVLLKCGSELEATVPVTLLINYQSPVKLQFTEKISFQNLPIDFSVDLEVYVMVLPEVKNDENSCATTIANKCRNLLGPNRKAHSSTGLPVGEFVRGGYLRLDRETTSFEKFYLDDAQYPLEGTISVTSSCTSLPHAIEVDYRGFLTMYQSIAGGSWERYWAVLRRGSIYFWKYPDEDAMGKPPRAYLKLQSCTKDVITPCTLDQCARSYTFSIEILVNTTPSNIEKKRIVLAADSREFMCAWIEAINETLSVIREH